MSRGFAQRVNAYCKIYSSFSSLIDTQVYTQVAIYSQTTIDMAETCIRFREHGARVMIEEKEIPHYAMHVDPVKKEVSCWIASKAGKVCGPLFSLLSFFLF